MAEEMTLGEKQRLFVRLMNEWVSWALAQGYELTDGESFRSDEQGEINALGAAGRESVAKLLDDHFDVLASKIRNNGKANGIRNSAHGNRLAKDWNLFHGGVYQTSTEAWRPLGEKWESMHSLCRWGGRFDDGNHLSLEHNGVK